MEIRKEVLDAILEIENYLIRNGPMPSFDSLMLAAFATPELLQIITKNLPEE